MEQKITKEKFKKFNEFKNENELMFNVKNESLMKKQLFSLMMAFALVLGLSAGAWAQTDYDDLPADKVIGSPQNPKIYLTGATDSVKVERGVAGSKVDWSLYVGQDATGALASNTDDLNTTVHTTWTNTQTSTGSDQYAYFRFKWTDQASGEYYLQVTETDQVASPDRTCAITVRGFHIYIMGFDVAIYASNAAGDSLRLTDTGEAAILLACSGSPTYDPFMNHVSLDGINNAFRTDIMNTANFPATLGDDLTNIIGTPASRVARNYTVVVRFDAPPADNTSFSNPGVGSVSMDIKINIPVVNGDDSLYVHSINGKLMADHGYGASLTNETVDLNGTPANYRFTFPVEFNDAFSKDDLEPTATVENVLLWSLVGGPTGGGNNLGEEPEKYEDSTPGYNPVANNYYDNTSNAFTIFSRPPTSRIMLGNE